MSIRRRTWSIAAAGALAAAVMACRGNAPARETAAAPGSPPPPRPRIRMPATRPRSTRGRWRRNRRIRTRAIARRRPVRMRNTMPAPIRTRRTARPPSIPRVARPSRRDAPGGARALAAGSRSACTPRGAAIAGRRPRSRGDGPRRARRVAPTVGVDRRFRCARGHAAGRRPRRPRRDFRPRGGAGGRGAAAGHAMSGTYRQVDAGRDDVPITSPVGEARRGSAPNTGDPYAGHAMPSPSPEPRR